MAWPKKYLGYLVSPKYLPSFQEIYLALPFLALVQWVKKKRRDNEFICFAFKIPSNDCLESRLVSVVNNCPLHQSTGQQRETQKVGRELIEVRRVAIQRDTGWFFLLVRP